MIPVALQSILICAIVAIPFLIVCGIYRALTQTGTHSIRRPVLLSALFLFGWLALAIYLGAVGTFRSALSQPFPYIGLAILGADHSRMDANVPVQDPAGNRSGSAAELAYRNL
jgi:hypothetical protein